jgi:MoaA/NifB/PqqE/SkfB family radical SAM enzyme
MELQSVHVLLTFRCLFECDHCFVWGGPRQRGTLTLDRIDALIRQAAELDSVEWFYFEGGEPFLYYPVLVEAVTRAVDAGFKVGIVTNGYWATTVDDAEHWLKPLAGRVSDLSVSSDTYHENPDDESMAGNACNAADRLGIPHDLISIAEPEETNVALGTGVLPSGLSGVMFRGRAAERLADRVPRRSWRRFTECPCEDLRSAGRVHVDPEGNVHLCQGISLGNVFRDSLSSICSAFNPDSHPIVEPLLSGGPAELIRRFGLETDDDDAADACHLCYRARVALRKRFPNILTPDQMYGEPDDDDQHDSAANVE